MKIVRDTIKSNIDFWLDINRNPRYVELVREYKGKPNPIWRFTRVNAKTGYYLCSFHSHTDGYRAFFDNLSDAQTREKILERVAKRAIERGFKLYMIADHNDDSLFNGELVKHYPSTENGGVFLLRGMECLCEDRIPGNIKPARTKILLGLYDGQIIPRRPLVQTVARAKQQNSLIFTTSTFHTGSWGISRERLEELMAREETDIDAIEVMDGGKGIASLIITSHYSSEIRAKHFSDEHKKATIYGSNDHVSDECGVNGNLIEEKDLPCLNHPEKVRKHPEILRHELKEVFRRRKIINIGGYVPALSFARPDRLRVVLADGIRSLAIKIYDLASYLDFSGE